MSLGPNGCVTRVLIERMTYGGPRNVNFSSGLHVNDILLLLLL